MDQIIAILLSTSEKLVRDLWQWLLANLNIIAIVGAFRAWSMHEHRRNATLLKIAQAKLATLVAETAKEATEKNHEENAQLAKAIEENTAISTKAFHEANSVNLKIANIGAEQVVLQAQQNAILESQEKKP